MISAETWPNFKMLFISIANMKKSPQSKKKKMEELRVERDQLVAVLRQLGDGNPAALLDEPGNNESVQESNPRPFSLEPAMLSTIPPPRPVNVNRSVKQEKSL